MIVELEIVIAGPQEATEVSVKVTLPVTVTSWSTSPEEVAVAEPTITDEVSVTLMTAEGTEVEVVSFVVELGAETGNPVPLDRVLLLPPTWLLVLVAGRVEFWKGGEALDVSEMGCPVSVGRALPVTIVWMLV